ncbi:CPBP family intramembrane metalloprotease [Anabaena cylindrica FACHB-243]|nr:type II CAAX endopeptidase family protein [Anabaena sp. CCAP 1446/1C]MBD2420793.1 CPBP family intramembrane metalloprotease [Anabaena cylindrica FACHB-243]MBY5282584.1 CPBP family intramembrane metalloprotease [Anabaena sp. CCAP 1446/1C]MBY5311120.1 CPBP family intramembrane metalloprotease [Anabaena sp. CCAP 1446/1C]
MQLTQRRRSLFALLISVPFTSIGAVMSLLIAPGIIGQTILVMCQLWLLFLPVAWLLWVERKPLKISKPTRYDWLIGLALGLLMFGIILATYWFFLRDWINVNDVRNKLQKVGNINQLFFKLGGAYFILINALIEEYFWRWFVYSRCEELVSGRTAVFLAALFFTIHHTIGLAVFTDWRMVLLGSLFVFVAGVVWSECYRRYRSIWSNYFSHLIADLALHIVAWQIFFG